MLQIQTIEKHLILMLSRIQFKLKHLSYHMTNNPIRISQVHQMALKIHKVLIMSHLKRINLKDKLGYLLIMGK